MRIVFLCGSLEPGKDGVGDYTRMLAGELIRKGHSVFNVALYDHQAIEISETPQSLDDIEINTIRISTAISDAHRFTLVKKNIEHFSPDWLSLQFVPFAFNPKGILSKVFIKSLLNLGDGFKWHFMFHELWVGMQTGTGLKLRLWGAVQKHYIKSLIRTLKPRIVHTQTQVYKLQLRKLGVEAKYLPLFSNIPLHQKDSVSVKNADKMQLVLFGSIHPTGLLTKFAEELSRYSTQHKTAIALTMIGRAKADEQQSWERVLTDNGIEVKILGEQSEQIVSEILSTSTVGISTTPTELAEKSGTIISMLNHGLEVVCLREPWIARGINLKIKPEGVHTYIPGNLSDLFSDLGKTTLHATTANEIADIFLNDLKNAK